MDDRTLQRGSRRDPAPDALDDPVWLGGEAMIAPYAQFSVPSVENDDTFADPDWHVL